MTEFFNPLPAEQVVRQVAATIGIEEDIVKKVCKRMEEEFVHQEWQLDAIDASEWKALEAPIGLAAAIRKLASVDDNANSHKKRKSQATPAMLSSRSPYAQRLTNAAKGATEDSANFESDVFKTPIEKMDYVKEECGDDDEDSKIEARNGKERELPSTPDSMFDVLYKNHRDAMKAFHSMTFPFSATFNRALLHSKSGEDLKAHTVFSLEIGVVVAALLLGASIEMWGAFPQDAVRWDDTGFANGGEPYVPYPLALVFHSLSFVSVAIQLMSVFLDVGQLLVATAVHPKKFHQFFQQISVTTSWTNGFFHLGVIAFIVNVAVLGMGMVLQTTSNEHLILICGLILPPVIVIPCEMFFHMLLTYVGRAAYNGFLLVPHEDPNSEDLVDNKISAKDAEKTLCQNYFRDLNSNDEAVLDQTQRLRKGHVAASGADGVESKTIRNSRLIVPTARKHNIGVDYFPKYQGGKKSA